MRKVLYSTLVLLGGASTALAADLPARRAPPVYVPPPIPAFSWTGLYIGAQAGYAFGRENTSYAITNNGPVVLTTRDNPNGFIGGGHVGYNFSTQSLPLFGNTAGAFLGTGGVIGIEGDVDGSNYHRSLQVLPGAFQSVRSDIQGSIRGRLGVAVDRVLFYATGGAAFADFRNVTDASALGLGTDVGRHSRLGWTVGGGVEYAFTPQWSVRAEYRYSDFARFSENLANSTLGAADARHHETMQRVQGGVSYKFAVPVAPVAARY